MTYGRIEVADDLPPAGPLNARAREKLDIDFKVRADRADGGEHAKDIALFANGLGGVIVVGASDQGGQLAYPGLQGQSSAHVVQLFEQAAQQRCSPNPVVDAIPVEIGPGIEVVAVNIDPQLDGVVGARQQGVTWTFPMRVATHTRYLTPEELPMYMNQAVRRTVILLSRIMSSSQRDVTVHFRRRRDIQNRHWDGTYLAAEQVLRLRDVAVEKNAVVFEDRGTQGSPTVRVPLLDVIDAWEAHDQEWDVKISGEIIGQPAGSGRLLRYRPIQS